jgi:membrane protease YdiL (CAAX protease family)
VRSWLLPERPLTVPNPVSHRATVIELLIVFSATLGLSALRSMISLLDGLLKPQPLNQQAVAINAPQATLDLLDLAAQLTGVLQLAAWGGLGGYLLWRNGFRPADIGMDRTRPWRDTAHGTLLALAIGIPGLGLYLLAQSLGVNRIVLPSTLGDTWWQIPELILAAAANSWAEELLVVGYLLSRLRQLGWSENRALLVSAVLRGSYHLYQGFGGFLGNLVMGLIFGRLWQRTSRLWPLVLAHTLLDVVSFVGYALLRDHVSWLP